MRRTLSVVWLLALVLILAACGTFQPDVELQSQAERPGMQQVFPETPLPELQTGEMINETPEAWFVEFSGPPTVKGGSRGELGRQRAEFRRAAAAEGIRYSERFDFQGLFNGLSVEASPAAVNKLSRLPGVEAVYPVVKFEIPEPNFVSEPDLKFALDMTGASIAQNELGLSGEGVRVAVMDTGIDLEHPAFAGRVVAGYDFVGDDFTAGLTPQPDTIPDDCNGHGTHVAGIVGGNDDTITGVAPGVEFGAYRVFGCEGSTTADIMIAAMEMALEDGMDVLNMSIGSAYTWPQYPTAVASDNLVDAGMVVVASIGNSGDTGIYSAGAPGVGEKVIGVASFDNTDVHASMFEVGGQQIGYNPMTFSVDVPLSGGGDIVYVGLACNGQELETNPSGLIALASRGTCSFAEKAANAEAAGAIAVVIHNNAPGNFNGTLGAPGIAVPVVSIAQADGLFIRDLSLPAPLTWLEQVGTFPNPTAGQISSFSSYGLAPDLSLKPDIGAPGGAIYSAYPLELGGYASISGTSMASPHVAGAVALLLEARPNTAAADVRGILQNSADPRAWWGIPNGPYLDSVHRQGAGMLDIAGAVQATASVTPAKLALGELQPGASFSTTLTLRNDSDERVFYQLSNNVDTITTATIGTSSRGVPFSTYAPGYFLSDAEVSFSRKSINIPAGGTATVDVTITNPGWTTGFVYGGYLEFTTKDGETALRVPYAGFGGDYQELQVLVPTPFNFPAVGEVVGQDADGNDLFNFAQDLTFSFSNNDIPYVLAHFEHQSRLVSMEVVPLQDPNRAYDTLLLESDYFTRNSTPTGFFAFAWDGTATVDGKTARLPAGDYQLKLTVVKALGDAGNPDHVETWTSPTITVAASRGKAE